MTLEERKLRAEQANRLLNDPMLSEAFAEVRRAYTEAWERTNDAQERERERLWLLVKSIDRIKGHLQSAMEDGKLVDKQILEIQPKKKFWG